MEQRHCRETLIAATLDLCTRQGYAGTTVEQIAAIAGLAPGDFARYFATKDAVVMSLVEDALHATAAALAPIDTDIDPTEALLLASTDMLSAIINGRGVMTQARMLALAPIIASSRHLQQQVSAARKHILTHGLATHLRVDPHDQRVRRAVTMWSAIMAGVNASGRAGPANHDLQHDRRLHERMIARLTETYDEVMGQPPAPENLTASQRSGPGVTAAPAG